MDLVVELHGEPERTRVHDKYGKACLESRWNCGTARFMLLSRHDTGRLVVNGRTTVKAKSCGIRSANGVCVQHFHLKDTARNRTILERNEIEYIISD